MPEPQVIQVEIVGRDQLAFQRDDAEPSAGGSTPTTPWAVA